MYLSANLVVQAARRLVGSSHEDILTVLVLKYHNMTESNHVHISSTDEFEGLTYLAWVGDGFAHFVEDNKELMEREPTIQGMPGRPQGTTAEYPYYFPITQRNRFILRNDGTGRSSIWTRFTGANTRHGINLLDHIYIFNKYETGKGADVRFRPGYEEYVAIYCATNEKVRLSIPWVPFVIWCSRNDEFVNPPTWKEIEDKVIEKMHLTPKEKFLWFSDDGIRPQEPLHIEDRDELSYYNQLLFDERIFDKPALLAVKGDSLDEKLEELKRMAEISGVVEDDMSSYDVANNAIARGYTSIILLGPPRTSKTFLAQQLAQKYLDPEKKHDLRDSNHFLHLQFHREVRYQDIIQRNEIEIEEHNIKINRVPGRLLKFIKDHQEGKSAIIIEEANRANLSAVLGELFQIIEPNYRGTPISLVGGDTIVIPREMLIICTMNDVDRSTYPIDTALLARFQVVRCEPSLSIARQILQKNGVNDSEISTILENFVHLKSSADYPIGHAYLSNVKDIDDYISNYWTGIRPALDLHFGQLGKGRLKACDEIVMRLKTGV